MVGQPVEQGRGHLGVTDHARPLRKPQIGVELPPYDRTRSIRN